MSVPGKPTRVRHALRVTAGFLIIAAVLFFTQSRQAERRFLAEVKGKPAPEFALEDLDGKTVKLSDLRGKPVVLAFWAVG